MGIGSLHSVARFGAGIQPFSAVSENLVTAPLRSALLLSVKASQRLRRVSQWLLSLLLLSASVSHFWCPAPFVQIVPPMVPWPLTAVYVSGAAEFFLGIALLIPRVSRLAAMGVVLLLVAVFPANIYHWLGDVRVGGAAAPGWYHAVRLPLQGVLVAWAFWLSRRPQSPAVALAG